MKKMLLVFSVMGMLALTGCKETPSSDQIMNQKQEQLAKELNAQSGMPTITRGTMKKQLKRIIEDCDKADLICYAYIIPEMTGKPVLLGKCMGYGIPYATQYTNPSKVDRSSQAGYAIMPQADPDGLFKPASADGTWLMMIDPNTNEPKPVYCEPKVLVSPFKLQ